MAGAIGGGIGGFLGAAHGTAEGLSELNEGRKLATSYLQNWKPADFTSTGLSGKFANNVFQLTRSPEQQAQMQQLTSLTDKWRPGFSDMRASRLAQAENARRRTIGNLRENLRRRRVLGSSFAQDALTRAEMDFSQQKDQIVAESFLQELQAMQQNAILALNQFNFESGIASNMTNSLNQISAQNTQLSAQLTAELYAARAGLWANWQQSHLNMLEGAVGSGMASGGGFSGMTGG